MRISRSWSTQLRTATTLTSVASKFDASVQKLSVAPSSQLLLPSIYGLPPPPPNFHHIMVHLVKAKNSNTSSHIFSLCLSRLVSASFSFKQGFEIAIFFANLQTAILKIAISLKNFLQTIKCFRMT